MRQAAVGVGPECIISLRGTECSDTCVTMDGHFLPPPPPLLHSRQTPCLSVPLACCLPSKPLHILFPLLGMPFLHLSAWLTPIHPVHRQLKGHCLQEALLSFHPPPTHHISLSFHCSLAPGTFDLYSESSHCAQNDTSRTAVSLHSSGRNNNLH